MPEEAADAKAAEEVATAKTAEEAEVAKADTVDESQAAENLAPLERNLVPWDMPSRPAPGLSRLEEGEHQQAWDQFKHNEEAFGVASTYNEELYTTALDTSSVTPQQMQEAERLACEIEEGKSFGQREEDAKDERDEEAKFSAVAQPSVHDAQAEEVAATVQDDTEQVIQEHAKLQNEMQDLKWQKEHEEQTWQGWEQDQTWGKQDWSQTQGWEQHDWDDGAAATQVLAAEAWNTTERVLALMQGEESGACLLPAYTPGTEDAGQVWAQDQWMEYPGDSLAEQHADQAKTTELRAAAPCFSPSLASQALQALGNVDAAGMQEAQQTLREGLADGGLSKMMKVCHAQQNLKLRFNKEVEELQRLTEGLQLEEEAENAEEDQPKAEDLLAALIEDVRATREAVEADRGGLQVDMDSVCKQESTPLEEPMDGGESSNPWDDLTCSQEETQQEPSQTEVKYAETDEWWKQDSWHSSGKQKNGGQSWNSHGGSSWHESSGGAQAEDARWQEDQNWHSWSAKKPKQQWEEQKDERTLGWDDLDWEAQELLQGLPDADREHLLSRLQKRAGQVKNPSGWIKKAVKEGMREQEWKDANWQEDAWQQATSKESDWKADDWKADDWKGSSKDNDWQSQRREDTTSDWKSQDRKDNGKADDWGKQSHSPWQEEKADWASHSWKEDAETDPWGKESWQEETPQTDSWEDWKSASNNTNNNSSSAAWASWEEVKQSSSHQDRDGVYLDTWSKDGDRYRLAFSGATVEVYKADGDAWQVSGNVKGETISLTDWRLTGKLVNEDINWENCCVWKKEKSSSQESSSQQQRSTAWDDDDRDAKHWKKPNTRTRHSGANDDDEGCPWGDLDHQQSSQATDADPLYVHDPWASSKNRGQDSWSRGNEGGRPW
eukprot:TRINITY_DN15337_c0_g1_i3.p1 TRINITY_DN15337_c0_g1~~TRINITY_DN15337_c0_g1_i3.p1  ORF type:complete len:1034 (+),score=395.71 TRINITY_DN15337_c0_g1_i3:425-3103(+)